MLREVLIGEQDNPTLKRRWFESDYFDLFIWQDAGGAFVRFQLCYDVELNERALVWSDPEGFYHDGVDPGTRWKIRFGNRRSALRARGGADTRRRARFCPRQDARSPDRTAPAENGPQARAARALAAAQTPGHGASKELTPPPRWGKFLLRADLIISLQAPPGRNRRKTNIAKARATRLAGRLSGFFMAPR